MSENSNIQWTDHTFNPWIGCSKVSPGCQHCYAETLMDTRYGKVKWGKGQPRQRTSAANWKLPLKWNREAAMYPDACANGHRLNMEAQTKIGNATCPSQHDEDGKYNPSVPRCGARIIPNVRPRVFCASLADWLDDEVPIEWLADLLKLIHDTPNLDWLLLTKRPENWRQRLVGVYDLVGKLKPTDVKGDLDSHVHFCTWLCRWTGDHSALREFYNGETSIIPPNNVWLGTTVENQAMSDKRIPVLAEIPARVRFLSVEPMLEQIDLGLGCDMLWKCPSCHEESEPIEHTYENELGRSECGKCGEITDHGQDFNTGCAIHWAIFGGESGHGSRMLNVEWIRSGVKQCREMGISPFVKQLGADPRHNTDGVDQDGVSVEIINTPLPVPLKDKKGGTMEEWPADLRIREFPKT